VSKIDKKRNTYLEIIKNKNFLLLMISQGISNTGDWLIIGILIILINSIAGPEASTLAVSGLWIAKMLPIIFSPVIGTLVDTVDRKKGMVISDLTRGTLILMLPFLYIKFKSLWVIYSVIFLLELFTLFFVPSKDASIPNIVKKEEILDANSLSFSINQISMFAGLALGTTIVFTVNKIFAKLPILKGFVGAYTAIYVDAISFFISATVLLFIAFPKKEKNVAVNYKKFTHDILESFKYLTDNKKIRWLIISAGFSILGLGTVLATGPAYADRILHAGNEGFLPLLTFLALGLLTGAVVVGFISRFFSKEDIFAASLCILGISLMAFAFISNFTVAIILSLIAGFGLGQLYVSAYTIMHENISDEIRGRLFTTLEADLRLALIMSVALTGLSTQLINNFTKIGIESSRIILFGGGVIVTAVALYAVKHVLTSVHFKHGQTKTSG
jgi:dTMP kinase